MAENNATYWQGRQEQLHRAMERDEETMNRDLARFYEKQQRELDRQIAEYYAEYGEGNVIEYRQLMETLPEADRRMLIERADDFAEKYPEYAHLLPTRESIYKLNRLEGLQYSIAIQQIECGAKEESVIGPHLKKWASENYAAALGIAGGPFAIINPNIAEIVTSQKWVDGMNFSDRIWANKEKMTRYMQDDFAAGIARGDSYDSMIRDLRKRFDTEIYEAKRLIWTEGTFVTEEASARAFVQAGFEEYLFWTNHDEKTCSRCVPLDGTTWPFDERQPGVNFPPIHPNCRCGFEVIVPREDGEGLARGIQKIMR